jgi:hypothetical protein
MSCVCIADITAVRPNEFIAQAIAQWLTSFIFVLLYADIILLVSKASSSNYKNFMAKWSDIIQKLKSPNIPEEVVAETTLYLDYTYNVYEGVS